MGREYVTDRSVLRPVRQAHSERHLAPGDRHRVLAGRERRRQGGLKIASPTMRIRNVTPAAGATTSGRRSASVNGRGFSAVAASAATPSLGTSTKRITPLRIAVSASLIVTHQYLSKPHCVSKPSSTPVPRATRASGASNHVATR